MTRICPQCGERTDARACPRDGYHTVLAANYEAVGPEALIGAVFAGRYEVDALLGEGGFGGVYRATQIGVARSVALKVLDASLTQDLKEVARFQQEARALAALNHENVVVVHDFGQTDEGHSFLVMEFVDGRSLRRLLDTEAPMEPSRLVSLGLQAFDGLAEAHEAGIIHRDIKPANLMVVETRRGERLKIVDFGIAKVSGEAAANVTLTATGKIIGSPCYMSPEHCLGRKLSPSADLYSLGVVLYEGLTGAPPFVRRSPTEYLMAHVNELPPPPSHGEKEASGPLVEVIMRLLAKEPGDRYPSAAAVVSALKACGDEPAGFETRTVRFEFSLQTVEPGTAVEAPREVEASPPGGRPATPSRFTVQEPAQPSPEETDRQSRGVFPTPTKRPHRRAAWFDVAKRARGWPLVSLAGLALVGFGLYGALQGRSAPVGADEPPREPNLAVSAGTGGIAPPAETGVAVRPADAARRPETPEASPANASGTDQDADIDGGGGADAASEPAGSRDGAMSPGPEGAGPEAASPETTSPMSTALVRTAPSGALVVRQREKLGRTPLEVRWEPGGPPRLVFYHYKGYRGVRRLADTDAGGEVVVRLRRVIPQPAAVPPPSKSPSRSATDAEPAVPSSKRPTVPVVREF